MIVEHIEFIVEEPSAKAFLDGLLGRLLSTVSYAIYPFQCKDELLKRLPDRLRGYSTWLPATFRIVVVVDRDDNDCEKLKAKLEQFAQNAGLATRNRRDQNRFVVVNRIVIEELEAWYFGDWQAVRAAYPRVPATVPNKAQFRDPDGIKGGTWEAFERVLQRAGYFKTGLRKIEAARAIVPYLEPSRNRSQSFQIFWNAVLELDAVPVD
jgi:hypothetical protein